MTSKATSVNHVLLLGAGFSRNWGGWLSKEAFEYLLGSADIIANPRLRQLLWKHQPTGGFEDALAELQVEYARDGRDETNLRLLQNAIESMFADMQRGYEQRQDWEFSNERGMQVGTFLCQFEAIFSLNQDLFLELRYLNDNVMLNSDGKWSGWQLPGMKPAPEQEWQFGATAATSLWIPDDALTVHARQQPLFKLHGSSNWRNTTGSALVIMGGNKAREIRVHPVLNTYAQQFESYLYRPETRLMVIGYGFRDSHINATIAEAVTRGLKMFIIDPDGSDLARKLNPTRHPGMISAATPLEEMFESSLIGASRRSLREVFGTDSVEHGKVMRFFTRR